ncbi:MAG: hypothetical protein QOE50_646 [Sphingomonadales bacterium]|jgi:hypothetical protein|nr:hypothetical protein [Sphingomonadales bacterium]
MQTRQMLALLAGASLGLAPSATFAAPGHPPGSGDISPTATSGQPGVECDDGTPPGNSGEEHGNALVNGSPFGEGTSVSGSHYAREQPGINDKNTASVSQYDIACFRGSDRPQ